MENQTTPPPCDATTDGSADVALLRAISENPDCAHVLAEIAAGGDPVHLISTLLPSGITVQEQSTEQSPEESPESHPAEVQPDVHLAMYQSLAASPAEEVAADSCPGFLSFIRPDFWDGF